MFILKTRHLRKKIAKINLKITAETTKTMLFSYRPKFQTVTTNGISATRPRVHDHLTPIFYKNDATNM